MLVMLVAALGLVGIGAVILGIVVVKRRAARDEYVPTQREAFYRRSQAWSRDRWDHL
jgi:hypothetical protein